ncbi:Glycerol kinase [Pseudobythopirellula maris]|uniref:ATP:glycerol 3-phosphotransferase n=1 Tax=Pseudobythopirellula maris TaxID=2527991 RepID=A0A5C5ZU06_9BACT|nr:glycerol kinase GlpK [Pseudobythopirellula maris]TWT91054.1 Glycerol kinase [Pseudobythopirellula maris]
MSCLLAIDQSTSATKAILFDPQGRAVDAESREHRQLYPRPGWVEHDAEEIWQNTLSVVGALCTRQRELADQALGVAITNQRETVVVFDRATGKPLAPAIVWQCRRGDAVCDELRTAGHEAIVQAKTGLKLDAYFSASKLAWLVRERPEIAERLRSGDALIGTIDAYLIYRLTGGAVHATDTSNASRTLLYDIGALAWDDELCGLFGVPVAALPEVRESFAHFGETDLGGAFRGPKPICGVMGDSQASLFAQRCYATGEAKATFGSGTSVLVNIGPECRMPEAGAVAALAWVHRGEPTYAWEGIINYSAATIAWLKDQLGLIDDAATTGELASSVEDNGGVYLVPAFAGLSAPHWRPDARGAILGMTAHTTRAHVVRAALESIALQIRDVLDAMADEGSPRPAMLFADGGPTRNEVLMQMVADLARVEVTVAQLPESSATGAVLAGLLGLGVVGSFDELRGLTRETRVYRPELPEPRADELVAGWRAAVRRVL